MTRWRIVARRLSQAKANYGVIAMCSLVPLFLWEAVFGDGRDRRWPDPGGIAFDRTHGVDTAGIIPIAALDVDAPNWVYGFDYQAVELIDFADLLAPLQVDYAASTFIDLGAGKGRVLMMAAALPFAQRIGVELSAELARVAVENLTRFGQAGGDGAWEIVCTDAAAYRFPERPLVVFMYNPFTVRIMRAVIANLVASIEARPRRVLVIYVRPELEQMWAHAPGFRQVAATPRYRIYESDGGSA